MFDLLYSGICVTKTGVGMVLAPVVEGLSRLEDFLSLLELRKLAFLMADRLAHLGNFFFLLLDLLEYDLDRSSFDPRLAACRSS